MTIDVYPGCPLPTHHIKMSKVGIDDMGLILCREDGTPDPLSFRYEPLPSSGIRMYQGNKEYSDQGDLYLTTELDNWSLGRGTYTHHKNPGGFAESQYMYTLKEGELIRGGFPMYTDGIVSGNKFWYHYKPSTGGFLVYDTHALLDSDAVGPYDYHAMKFTTGASGYDLTHLHFMAYYVGNAGTLSVQIWSHDSGNDDPNTLLHTIGTVITYGYDEKVIYDIHLTDSSPYTLSASTTYWIVWKSDELPDSSNYWGMLGASSWGVPSEGRYGNIAWVDSGDVVFYRASGPRDDYKAHLFEYKSALFAALEYLDGGDSKLYINGDQGMVTSTTGTTTVVDGLATWAADEAIGCIIKIVQGPGSNQPQNWRLITDNAATSSGTTSFVHDAWDQNPTSSSLVVVVAADRWGVVDTSTPWSGKIVYDVLVMGGIIYFTHGDSAAMTSLRFYNNSGSWDADWNTSEVGQFTYLVDGADSDGAYIMGAYGGYPSQYQISSALEDGTALTGSSHTALAWEDATSVGNLGVRIRGLQRHGEYGEIYIFKENGVYRVINRLPYLLQISEMGNTTDDRNGVAHTSHGVYLWFSWADTVLRYYGYSLDAKGPSQAEVGLPKTRQGAISALETYPGMVIAAIDAGEDDISSILAYNDLGWHELYRAPSTGLRITNLKLQAIPGDHCDRLWFNCGSELIWIPISIDPSNHKNVDYNFYAFSPFSNITTAYLYNSRRLIEKLFVKVESVVDSSGDYGGAVDIFYRVDEENNWTYIGYFNSFSNTNKDISSTFDVSGVRIQFLLQARYGANMQTFKLNSLALHTLMKETKNRRLTLIAKLEDGMKDLQGNSIADPLAIDQLSALNEFENDPEPVLLRSLSTKIDNKYFVLDENGIVPRKITTKAEEYGDAAYIVRISMYEIT